MEQFASLAALLGRLMISSTEEIVDLKEVERLDQLTPEQIDKLPFGTIKLSSEGVILQYNFTEARAAGYDPKEVIGKNFFTEVAPCTRVADFYGRFQEGVNKKDLFVTFPYRFVFSSTRSTDVSVTLFYSKTNDSVWVMIQRTR